MDVDHEANMSEGGSVNKEQTNDKQNTITKKLQLLLLSHVAGGIFMNKIHPADRGVFY